MLKPRKELHYQFVAEKYCCTFPILIIKTTLLIYIISNLSCSQILSHHHASHVFEIEVGFLLKHTVTISYPIQVQQLFTTSSISSRRPTHLKRRQAARECFPSTGAASLQEELQLSCITLKLFLSGISTCLIMHLSHALNRLRNT